MWLCTTELLPEEKVVEQTAAWRGALSHCGVLGLSWRGTLVLKVLGIRLG